MRALNKVHSIFLVKYNPLCAFRLAGALELSSHYTKKEVGIVSKCHRALWVMPHLLSEAHCSRFVFNAGLCVGFARPCLFFGFLLDLPDDC